MAGCITFIINFYQQLNMPYYVYLLKSLKDGNYYIGQTNNIQKRLKEHNNGKVRSTKNRVPFILVGYEIYKTRNEARWREYELKHWPRRKSKFIKKLVEKYEKK